MSRRLMIHVGTPKSGTSYLQDRLSRNRSELRDTGLWYVDTRTGDHFEAALDLLGDPWAGALETARGQWDELVTRVRRSRDDVLISHEILSGAEPAQVERLLGDLSDLEPHVVLTVRDLGRQVPAEWQENVKHRAARTYASYLRRIERRFETPREDRFWRVQHLPAIVQAWGWSLPAGRVHLVTVPPSGSPPEQLWERYATALGLDPGLAQTPSRVTNSSLGGVEVALLRRLNIELAERRVHRDAYVSFVRDGIASQVLGAAAASRPPTVPPSLRPWIQSISESWIEQLASSGATVHGDLGDLRPTWPADDEQWQDPDESDPQLMLTRAIDSLAWLVERAAEQSEPGETADPPGRGSLTSRLVRRSWRRT